MLTSYIAIESSLLVVAVVVASVLGLFTLLHSLLLHFVTLEHTANLLHKFSGRRVYYNGSISVTAVDNGQPLDNVPPPELESWLPLEPVPPVVPEE